LGEKQPRSRERNVGDSLSSVFISFSLSGADDTMHFSFGAAAKEYKRLFYNDADFLLMMAIADGALFGYDTLDDLRQQVIPAGKNKVIFRFKKSALDQLILRKCIKAGGVTDEPMPKGAFLAVFKSTLINAGYLWNLSIHAIRRSFEKRADSKCSTQLVQLFEKVTSQPYKFSIQLISIFILIANFRAEYCGRTLTALNASRLLSFRSKLRGELLFDRRPSRLPRRGE
jgi:hypothetical protein